MEIIVIGRMDNTKDHTFECANRVYSQEGMCPTIPTNCGGDHLPKILEVRYANNSRNERAR